MRTNFHPVGTPGFVYALLESNLIHRERDDIGSGTDANSGGTQWLLAPGLQYVSRRWIVEGTAQFLVHLNDQETLMRVIQQARYRIAIVVAALLLSGCGAVNWNQEPPYQRDASWGEKGSAEGQFNDPTGIAVTADEVFVADARNNRIQVFDKQGTFKRAFGNKVLGRPMNMAIAGDRLYVPDYFKDVIHVFTLGGEYRRAIAAEDGLNSPGGLAVRPDGTLLIADTYAQRVVHLAPDGKVLKSWNGTGIGAGDFNYPTDVAIAPDGGFYVADGYNDRVQQFGPDGEFIRKWGGPFAMNIFGPFKGWFSTVTSVAIGPDGAVYAADFYNDRIQKFTAEGSFLTAFGTPTKGPGQSEVAVAVDADGTVWSANFAGNRVEKWRPAESP